MTKPGPHCPEVACVVCGTRFRVHPYRLQSASCCSLACRQRRAGRIQAEQRVGTATVTPYFKRNGQRIHRAVMAGILGRPLQADEHVHHRDGNKRNNAPENLKIVSAVEHVRLHAGETGRFRSDPIRRMA